MEFDKSELKTEPFPESSKSDFLATIIQEIKTDDNLSRDELVEKLELVLIERTRTNTPAGKKPSKSFYENRFILGQFYFEWEKYLKAYDVFDSIKNDYPEAMYQLGIILYDDLLDKDKSLGQVGNDSKSEEIDYRASLRHPNKNKWNEAVECMLHVANMPPIEPKPHTGLKNYRKLIHQAQYNVGKAYFQGFGVKQSDEEAEKWWLLSADQGSYSCVSAMTALAFFYSRKGEPEFFDLKKAFYWHNEACGGGSLESQGALGAMYYLGLGIKQDMQAAYECLSRSSERGNVYSMGLLCDYYYRSKFYIKAFELSKKVASLSDIPKIAKETNCLKSFVAKGIAMASFTAARCLDLGKGTDRDSELAQKFYKRSYHFDPDLCQLFQNQVTHQKI